MKVHEDLVQLGFAEDDGLGELLVERLLAGTLRVLWEPVDLLGIAEADAMRAAIGSPLTVMDSDGTPACNVRVTEVFETTWGDPDPRLVEGEGYGTNVDAWRGFVGAALEAGLADEGLELADSTVLLVQAIVLTEASGE
jgi:uncharacterized protein YhfF